MSGDTASSIPALPSLLTPPPETLFSAVPLRAGSLRPSGVTLKITPPQHKANKRQARAAGLPWLLSSPPRPGNPSASGPQASRAQASRPVPYEPASQRPVARAPLYCAREGTRGPAAHEQVNSEHSSSGPGRTDRSRPPGLGALGPAQSLALPPGMKGGTRSAPFPQSAPAGAGVRLQEKLGFRVCFPNKTTRTRALPRQGLGGLRAARGPRVTARASRAPGSAPRAAAVGRAGPGRCGPAACGSEARAALTGRLHGEGPEPGRPLAPVRSELLPARPRLLASRPRVPRSRPPPGSAGTSELEPLAAAPGFPQCTARRSSHPFPASRVRPPLPAPLGAPALTSAYAGPRTPTAPASVAPRPCGRPSAHHTPVCARELQGSSLRKMLVQSAAPQASAVSTYCVSCVASSPEASSTKRERSTIAVTSDLFLPSQQKLRASSRPPVFKY